MSCFPFTYLLILSAHTYIYVCLSVVRDTKLYDKLKKQETFEGNLSLFLLFNSQFSLLQSQGEDEQIYIFLLLLE